MFTCIIFDFYDVIRIDPYNKWLNDNGFERTGKFLEIAQANDRGLLNREEYFESLAQLSDFKPFEIQNAFENADEYDDQVIKIIKRLKKDYKLGLLSNASGPRLRVMINEKGLDQLFDEIIISGEVGYIKPEPEIFDFALKKLEVTPVETVFIDDNPENTAAAIEIGITGLVFTGYKKLETQLSELEIRF